ncbi:sensor histidine kinase [Maribellus maritimus]|uniref:sensor histidine kinase n=1 Tax=Maribellus maritimus TaxID=2870838 RepID=UPI001EECEA94|nr:histidine kinase [Maribellus maritimus]MCG6191123.1 hypothetical protein [Maribellus maritimus]
MSLKIVFRGKVLLAVIIFTTITCTGIIYISVKSLQLDREHLLLLKLSKNIDLEISHSRIFFNDYFLFNDSLKKTTVLNSFTNTNKSITSLDSLIGKKYKGNTEFDLRKSLETVTKEVKELENEVTAALLNKAKDYDVAILNNYRHFQLAFQELEKRIAQYILHENIKFKQRVVTLVLLTFFLLLFCIFLIYRIINSYNAIEKQQAVRALEVEYKERKRIAADLHDGLGSILSSIALFIKLIEKDCNNKAENKSLIQVKELSGIALENLEAIINNLNPSILNRYGLVKSLEILCDRINETGKITCIVNSNNTELKLEPNIELNIYRICNELINNTLKHADATELFLDIQQIKRTLTIFYRDNGKGFDTSLIYTSDEEKMGLRNIVNRLESYGGRYTINSGEGKGVEIMLIFNL